jgi:glycosyltransferase involved in cell wall biosynthesis
MLRNWLGAHDLPPGIGREIRPLLFNPWALDRSLKELRADPPKAIVERLSLFGHLGLDLAEILDIPLIVEVNAPLTDEASNFRSLQLQGLAAEIERRVLQRADRIAVVSCQLAGRLIADGVSEEKIDVIPNGVDENEFVVLESRGSVRRRLGIDGGFTIGFAGSLKPWHGVSVLLAAFAEIAQRDPHARLLIVGTGPSEGELQAEVLQRKLGDRVVFTGAVPHEQIPSLLAAMDVAVAPFLPVEDFYFSPIKLFEYMAAGTCVVASRIGQMAEVIEDGMDGLLCEPGDAAGLLEQIERARQFPILRKAIADSARKKVLSRYTWMRAARQLEAIIESELSERKPQEVREAGFEQAAL